MLEILKDKFDDIKRYIARTGKIREQNIDEAVKKIKMALLEADVNYKVVKHFINNVKEKSLGQDVAKSVTPSQQFIKIVNNEMLSLFGSSNIFLPDLFPSNKITTMMLVGLNGSGKTTTSVKLAQYYKKSKPMIIAGDVYRAAAIEQLEILCKKNNIPLYSDKNSNNVLKIIKDGINFAKQNEINLIIIDTAGRMEVDETLMDEIEKIDKNFQPDYNLFVADSLTGQNLINVAAEFEKRIKLKGAILTKFDSDARGGAALSLKYITNLDILFIGTGEKINDLETFRPEKIVNRILGMADVVTLVEEAEKMSNQKDLEKLQKKIKKQTFDFNDFLEQMRGVYKTGAYKKILEVLPINIPIQQSMDEKRFKHIEAIILSMTPKERENPDFIDLSRKLRISKGAGRPLSEVNQLIKQFHNAKKMLKKFLKNGINNVNLLKDFGSLTKMYN